MKIAFFGTGLLGAGFVRHMLDLGHAVEVWNRSLGKARALEPDGARAWERPEQAVRGVEQLHLALSDDDAVDQVLEPLADALAPETWIVDHTTTAPTPTAERVRRWDARGRRYVHAPVFMGPANARDGSGLMQGVVAKPIGTRHPNIAPYGDIFTSADGTDFLLAVGSDDQFKKLWKTLMPGVAINPNFESNSGRVKNRKELCKALQQSFGSNPFVKIETLLGTINVPYCSILKMNDVFQDKLAKEMVLTQTKHDETGQSVSSIAFTIK